jgi:hypothetical protein
MLSAGLALSRYRGKLGTFLLMEGNGKEGQ